MLKTKWPSLAALAGAQVLALSLWFSATAVVPSLRAAGAIDALSASLFTSAVQAGFVVGTLISAVLGLADRIDPRRFFAVSAVFACAVNALILLVPPGGMTVPLLRFLTGMAMAGIYPVGMKLAATWANRDLGLLVGILVGALTLGSASPHLFNALGGVDWHATIATTSVAAIGAALLINLVGLGPKAPKPRAFQFGAMLEAFRTPALRLANLGYLGHMWELYAMWAWIATFLTASFTVTMGGEAATFWARIGAFATVGSGAVGCLIGGLAADRWGRTTVTMTALAVSGSCSLLIGMVFGASPALVMLVCIIWGVSVIADSAQFSASVTELSVPEHLGTMLTIQTSTGFLLSMLTIHLVPVVAGLIGGLAADRWGRTTVTMTALAVSGSCSLLIGMVFGASPALVMLVCIIWGVSVIADSAQFSASVTELSVPEHLGTMLTIQTSTGFLLSMLTIHLVPIAAGVVGWQLAFAILAPGPVVGIWAMGKLRASIDARRLAGGRG